MKTVEELIFEKRFKGKDFNQNDYNDWAKENEYEAYKLCLQVAREFQPYVNTNNTPLKIEANQLTGLQDIGGRNIKHGDKLVDVIKNVGMVGNVVWIVHLKQWWFDNGDLISFELTREIAKVFAIV